MTGAKTPRYANRAVQWRSAATLWRDGARGWEAEGKPSTHILGQKQVRIPVIGSKK
jgi:hypothetical protein